MKGRSYEPQESDLNILDVVREPRTVALVEITGGWKGGGITRILRAVGGWDQVAAWIIGEDKSFSARLK